jgi:hypothetical protein
VQHEGFVAQKDLLLQSSRPNLQIGLALDQSGITLGGAPPVWAGGVNLDSPFGGMTKRTVLRPYSGLRPRASRYGEQIPGARSNVVNHRFDHCGSRRAFLGLGGLCACSGYAG